MTTPADFSLAGRLPMFTKDPDNYAEWKPPLEVVTIEDANLVASMTEELTHRPVIDLDVPARLYPSTTEGHSHLYIDVDLTHEKYRRLLEVLVECGILGGGILKQFEMRGATFARPPWVKKANRQEEEAA